MKLYSQEFDLQHHGDYLEQIEFGFIRSRLNAYEEIWKRFIGHDGKGKMPVLQIPEQISKLRIDAGECMYTCLESIVCMRFVVDEVNRLQVEKYPDYIKFLNILMCFESHAGRVRDNAKNLVESVVRSKQKQKKIILILEDYYKRRHNVLHGRKIPFDIFEKSILIPVPQGKDISDLKKWSSDMAWDKISSKSDIQFLSDYLKNSFEGIVEHLNQVFYNVIEDVEVIVSENNIVLTPPNESYVECDPSGSVVAFPDMERLPLGKTLQWPSGSFNYDTE